MTASRLHAPRLEAVGKHTSTPFSWSQKVRDQVADVEAKKSRAALIRKDAELVQQATANLQLQSKDHTNQALVKKIEATRALHVQSLDALFSTESEIANLESSLEDVVAVHAAKHAPSASTDASLAARERRPQEEATRDEARRLLLAQKEVLRTSQAWMVEAKQAHEAELAHLKDLRSELESDVGDKTASLRIDLDCLNLDPAIDAGGAGAGPDGPVLGAMPTTPAPPKFVPSSPNTVGVRATTSPRAKFGASTRAVGVSPRDALLRPAQWSRITSDVCQRAAQHVATGQRLRQKSARLMQTAAEAEEQSHAQVLGVLEMNLNSVAQANATLEQAHAAACDEVASLAKRASQIKQTWEDQQGPLAVIQGRMSLRDERPNLELVEDAVQAALRDEWGQVTRGQTALMDELEKVNREMDKLIKSRDTMAEEMEYKKRHFACEEEAYQIQREWLTFSIAPPGSNGETFPGHGEGDGAGVGMRTDMGQ